MPNSKPVAIVLAYFMYGFRKYESENKDLTLSITPIEIINDVNVFIVDYISQLSTFYVCLSFYSYVI